MVRVVRRCGVPKRKRQRAVVGHKACDRQTKRQQAQTQAGVSITQIIAQWRCGLPAKPGSRGARTPQ